MTPSLMDDQSTPENPPADFNKIDLTQLQGFSFGTQWSQDKNSKDGRREERGGRRDAGGEMKRDRRGFKKAAGDVPSENFRPSSEQPQGGGERRERREGGGPGRDFHGQNRGGERGPRRDFGGDRGGDRSHDRGTRAPFQERDRGPYISPFFNVTFYPDDSGFSALAKAIRASCRTYELFEIAKVIIGKNDRFVAVVQRKPAEGAESSAKSAPFAIAVPDGVPFETEEAAISHVASQHLGQFFDTAEVEVDPPKGNFQVVNKCTITGELLGPPNYHRYNQIVAQHHATRIQRMSLDQYRSRIESVRDPEAIAQWLAKMKKVTRYTWKAPLAEGETAPSFDSIEDARSYLLNHAKDKVVRTTDNLRFPGKLLETLPAGEIKMAIEGTLERQRRFPLDTANALRGRLRREGFTIFKKGSKGISYVCAVKRKFRVPGQTFSDSIGGLISFIEANPMVKASELPAKFLNIQTPATPAPAVAPAPTAEGEVPAPAPTPAPSPALSAEDHAKLHRMNGDLRWLVSEGYVTEFIDGRLFAPPPMTEARKQEVEKSEHDPENFPEVPHSPAPAAASEAPAKETPTNEAPAQEAENPPSAS